MSRELLASLQPLTTTRWLMERPEDRFKTVTGTVVSADISGFTRLAERLAEFGIRQAAESLNETINRCFVPMIDEVMDRDGDVLKFGGDAIFAIFTGPDSAAQACAAASKLQEIIRTVELGHDISLSMTVGVASGSISMILTATERRELIVEGPVVDCCLRLESEAEPGEVLISRETADAIPAAWVLEPEPDLLVLAGPEQISLDLPARQPIPERTADQLAMEVGNDLADAVDAYAGAEGELRMITVAFIFLPTVGLDPETVALTVERCIRICGTYEICFLSTDVAEGGVKILLTAGAPTGGDSDEDLMLGAVSDIVFHPDAPPMRCGINRGLAYAGFLGSSRCQTFTVMGDTTNLAARLLGKSTDGAIAISQPVLDHTRAHYDTTELLPVLVKGRVAPVTVHQLSERRAAVRRPAVTSTFVGRDVELAKLEDAFDRARDGYGTAINIIGEAGMGSSRLVSEFLSVLAAGVLRFELTGQAANRAVPYATLHPFLRSLATIGDADDDTRASHILTSWVDRIAPELVPRIPLIAPAFDVELDQPPEPDTIRPEFRQELMTETLTTLLSEALTLATVLVVEDLHWVDSASLALLNALADLSENKQWLLISCTRPGLASLGSATEDKRRTDRSIELGPLSQEAAIELVGEVTDLPRTQQAELATAAGGNPLFILEMAKTSGAEAAGLDSIEGLVTAQIDRLGHRSRTLARTASVFGQRFQLEQLAALVDTNIADVAAQLADLQQLMTPAEPGWWAFTSEVVHQVAYGGLSANRRRALHSQIAEALVDTDADVAQLAWHNGEAGNHSEAWRYHRQSAERARNLGLMADATEHLINAVAAADGSLTGATSADSQALLLVLLQLFDAAEAAERYADALDAAVRFLDSSDNRLERAKLLFRYTKIKSETDGSFGAGIEALGDELARCKTGTADAEARAWLEAGLAGLHYREGDFAETLAMADAAVADAETASVAGPAPGALLMRHNVLSDTRHPGAIAAAEAAIEAATAADDYRTLAAGHNNIGIDLLADGRWDEAAAHFGTSAETSEAVGDTYRALFPSINRATILTDQGRWEEARAELDEDRRIAMNRGNGFLSAWAQRELGRLEALAGHPDRGRPWLNAALQWVRTAGVSSSIYEVEITLIIADLTDGKSSEVLAGLDRVKRPTERQARQLGWPDICAGYAHLQQGQPDLGGERFDMAIEETTGRYLFGHACALIGRSETDGFLGRGRASQRAKDQAAELLDGLGVINLPVIPLPK